MELNATNEGMRAKDEVSDTIVTMLQPKWHGLERALENFEVRLHAQHVYSYSLVCVVFSQSKAKIRITDIIYV